jgi:ankyrin repeat protein
MKREFHVRFCERPRGRFLWPTRPFVKEPSTRAATIEAKIISESVVKGDITKIQEAIQAGADVNVRYKYGFTPLLIASRNGHTEIVRLLLTANADVNAPDKTNGFTPLWKASQKGHTEIVKLLLTARADVNAVDKKEGVSPLWIASRNGHTEVVKLLLTAKADVNAADKTKGVTPLWKASQNGHTEIVKLLLTAGADVNEADKTKGVTSLWIASERGHVEIVKLLLTARVMLILPLNPTALLRCGLHREMAILKSSSCCSRLRLMLMQLTKQRALLRC